MDNFTFRTQRSFYFEIDYKRVLKIIERIKSRCQNYKIWETFSEHPANAFNGMSLPLNDSEENLYDEYSLYHDAADNLLDLNKSISGKYAWDAIADVVDTRTGVGMDDWHWTLRAYTLKPEYAKLLIDNLDILKKEIEENYEIFIFKKKEKEAAREVIKKSISAIKTTEREITDEGGSTKMYKHIITFHDGEELVFTERNVFDLGVVINPLYSIYPGAEPGGVCLTSDGILQWHEFEKGEGWVPVRPLTKNERTAMKYLNNFGGFARSSIRM